MKKISFVLTIGLFLLAWGYTWAQEESTKYNGLIKGKVTDTQTPEPNNLSNVAVTAKSELFPGTAIKKTATTDMAGNYEITNLSPGKYVMTISKLGYDVSSEHVTVTPDSEVFHDVRLYKTDTLVTYYWKMGPVKRPILFCFMLSWAAVVVGIVYMVRRIVRLRKSRSEIGDTFISRVMSPLQNRDVPGAISICDEVGGLANILKAGLLRYSELNGKGEVVGEGIDQLIWQEEIRKATEEAGDKAKMTLRFHWRLIAAMYGIIGGMSLLYGLLGTAIGIIRSLTVITIKGTNDIQLLAGGIAEVSLASAAGVIGAIYGANMCIITLIVYLIYKKKTNDLISRTQQTFVGMVNSLFATQIPGNTRT